MNWITQHPYWTATAFIYLCLIAWMVHEMRKAPYENTVDDLPNIHDTHFD